MTGYLCNGALRRAGLVALLILSAGCAAIQSSPLGRLPGLGAGPVDARTLLTPDILNRVNLPYLLVIRDKIDFGSTFSVQGENPPVRTWFDGNLTSLSINRLGLIVRSAGFGRDLMTADVAVTEAALRRGGEATTTRRVHRLLDGNDKVVATAYACRIEPIDPVTITLPTGAFQTFLIEETCADAAGRGFQNSYWIDLKTGSLRQSRQWISPEVGTLTLQVLHD